MGVFNNLFGRKEEAPATTYWLVKTGLTLMVYRPELEMHAPTDVRHYDYFFKVPAAVRTTLSQDDLEKRFKKHLQDIYNVHRFNFQKAEPTDTSYIAIVETTITPLDAAASAQKVWMNAALPNWEDSHCIALTPEFFEKENPATF